MTNPPHNVELEAAKFLHKLIQDSKDEPKKLATKLYVILQHMRSSGKENSMPYQVISRAMETVIKQHELDIEALMSTRHPMAPSGSQLGESGSSQVVGSSPRAGVSKDPNANLAGNELSKPDIYPSGLPHGGPSSGGHDLYPSGVQHGGPSSGGHDTPNTTGGGAGITPSAASSYPLGEMGVSVPKHFASSSYDNHGFAGKMLKEGIETFPSAAPSMDPYTSKTVTGGPLDHEGANLLPNPNKPNQVSDPISVPEISMSRNVAPRDTGKAPLAQAQVSGLPFKEHHLKQLRAQCLVFLAFRNGLMPKKLHLEIALGNFFPREDGPRRDTNDHKGKEQSVHEQHSMSEVSGPTAGLDNTRGADKLPTGTSITGIYPEANFSLGADNPNMKEDKTSHQAVPYEYYDERRPNLGMRRKPEIEMSRQERSESQASSIKGMQYESAMRSSTSVSSRENDSGINQQQHMMAHPASFVPGTTKYMKPDMSSWHASEYQLEASRIVAPGMILDSQLRKENAASQFQSPDNNSLGHRHTDSSPSLPLREQWKPIPGVDGPNVSKNSDVLVRNVLPDYYMDDQAASVASPKYTTLDYWIMDKQKRKLLAEQTLAVKHQKIEEKKIAVCSAKLKESVTSSEDINEKTKRVIELKKLKLLELQRRLRSEIMDDFFKPIASDLDRLKSIKKHRIGRRSKQLERYEGKMKEERQKRMRERQKDFFSELDVHRERLEDGFKMRRERWKGLNRNVREFHKRKERIHREKNDRIQREKINLLKINDVEGYLRMVKDAKSDRVKQLLKETEKYLSKLGSKLQQAKNTARRFDSDVDDGRNTTMVEKNEVSFENEDETDQAKHYLESNEKYYLLAHSVKETVLEQPAMLVGGKLREYQMNGLRWLVSLYNNHLNGILADEMGLGKTVQVISLLCHLMETKNDRGPFLVVVPSSVLPGWETEINFWAPELQKIVYSGPPEERRRLFKEQIISQKFNVLLTTYEYLMNKHDRPKLSKVQWHYIIIDEGHRIKNASCKLNADLKHYRSNHRLLLTGTPLQNNLEELWALLNFLLPNIFNSSEDFSQWFNKPFESNGDSSADEALLSEEENLLIINRLHQVLRPFVLRRLKHKVENELPEKIERLIRCEASGYQKLLMKRVEDNLGAFGATKVRSVHNSVMELRNICNHPYLSQLHIEEVHEWMPKHYLPNIIRLCGKLEMLDRLLPKLKETDHRVLLFSTMTRLLDVMEDYLCWKQYKYLRLDGHTSGGDRGALIDKFNQPGSPFFIFLLSIRAGGVGVNLQAADTVIIFDTDWNPQVDLQAQARAHRIGQKKDVLVLRLETVQTVEEQVRASAEHKLGVANQSITAGFFDNNTSAEDRREYLESLLRECKKEEAAPVLDDDGLNDIIARSESEIDVFESIDRKRRAEEREAWVKLIKGNGLGDPEGLPPLPSRLLMEDELKSFSEAMKIFDVPQQGAASNSGTKRKGDHLGGLDTRHYGRGKRAREVRSYEEQLTEEEFEKLCQVEGEAPVSPRVKQETIPRVKEELTPQVKGEIAEKKLPAVTTDATISTGETQQAQFQQLPPSPIVEPAAVISTEVTPPSKRGRGRPRRTPTTELSSSPGVNQYSSGRQTATELSPSPRISLFSSGAESKTALPAVENVPPSEVPISNILPSATPSTGISVNVQLAGIGDQSASLPPSSGPFQPTTVPGPSMPVRGRGRGRKAQSVGEPPRRRGKRQSASVLPPPMPTAVSIQFEAKGEVASSSPGVGTPNPVAQHSEAFQVPLLSASKTSESDSGSQVQVLSQSIQSDTDACSGSLGPQQLPVSNQSTAAASDAPSGSGVTGASNFSLTAISAPLDSSIMAGDAQDPVVMGSPSPNPVPIPSFPSTAVSQAVALADSAPKQGRGRGRGRGRGLKAQSGVEGPRRRGKRQNPDEPTTFEVSTVQDPKLVEVPEKKPRVSVARRPTRRSKQEQDLLNQPSALSSGSPSITNPVIKPVSDSRPEEEGANSTKNILFDVAPNLVSSDLQPVHETKEDNKTEKPMIPGSEVLEESEIHKQAKSNQSNLSEYATSLPISKVLANSDTVEESKAARDDEFMSSKNRQGEKAQKQMNLVKSDPSLMRPDVGPTLASEVEQKHVVSKPNSANESDPSQSISNPSSRNIVNEADQLLNINNMDVPDSVLDPSVASNKDLLLPCMDANTLHNKSDPSVGGVDEVDRETKSLKEADMQSDMNAGISKSAQRIVDSDDKESAGHSNVVISEMVAVSEHASEEQVNAGMMNDVIESEGLETNPEVQLDMTAVILESDMQAKNGDNTGSVHASSIDDNSNVCHGEASVAVVVGEMDLENEVKKETDVQSDKAAMNSVHDTADIGDDMSKDQSVTEMGMGSSSVVPVSDILHVENEANAINEVIADKELLQGASAVSTPLAEDKSAEVSDVPMGGINSVSNKLGMMEVESKVLAVCEFSGSRSQLSVTPVSDILHVENEENAVNKAMDDKELLQGATAVLTPPTEDEPVEGSDVPFEGISSVSNELHMMEVESKVSAVSDFSGSRSQCSGDNLLEENSHSTTTIVQSAIKGSSCVSEPENQAEELGDSKCIVDDALVSDLEMTANTKECRDDSILFVSNKSGISAPIEQSCEGGDLAAASSVESGISRVETLSETILAPDGSKKIEQKGQFDGSKTSLLVNEDVAASDSGLFSERSDSHFDKMVVEHENENVPIRDSGSVLCDDGHVAAISGSLPSNTEASIEKKDADDSVSKAAGHNKVPMLEQTDSSQETPLPTLGTVAPEVGQVDVSNTENKENELADGQENISSTVESLGQKQEVSEVTMGKADPEEVINDITVAVLDGPDVESPQVTDEKTSCDEVENRHVDVISNSETCELRPADSSGKSENQPGVGNGSNAETSAETLKVSEESTSVNAEDDLKKLETRHVDVISNYETCELRPTGSSGKSENQPGVGNGSNAETSAETLKVSEESTYVNAEDDLKKLETRHVDVILNSETCELRPTGSSGKYENQPGVGNGSNAETSAEILKVSEESTAVNAEGDDLKKLETIDQTVEKECLAGVDVTDSQCSEEKILPSYSVLETVNRVIPNAEVIEGRNTQSETETNCPGKSLDTEDDSIGRNASLSLQVASLDAAHAEVVGEEAGMMHKDSASEVVESEKTAAAELPETQTGATAGTSQPKNGLEQLVEEYTDAE